MRFHSVEGWLDWQSSSHIKSIDLGLDRVKAVAERLGVLKPAPLVITVGGTNGKGSSVAMLEAILQQAGYAVGCYTSPHLIRYNERIRYRGQLVGDAALCQAFDRIDQACEGITLTYFEWGTLAALEVFNNQALDIVLLEVGLGGRLDAVNVVDADVALITSLGVDHTEWLGDTREAISLEKLGIARTGRPLVCSDPQPPEVFVSTARALGVELSVNGHDFHWSTQGEVWGWCSPQGDSAGLPMPALEGAHQLQNASGVLKVIQLINDGSVTDEHIKAGLRSVTLKGRFERISGDINLVLDVAHNADGSKRLADALRSSTNAGRCWCLLGVLNDKDAESMFLALDSVIDYWVLTAPDSDRALSVGGLAKAFERVIPEGNYQRAETVAQGFDDIRSAMAADDTLVVTGSFYTVGEVQAVLEKN